MNSLKPYSEKSKCGACGSDGVVATIFHKVTNASGGEDKSYIERRCYRCKYAWRELPLYKVQGCSGPAGTLAKEGFSREEVLDIVTKVLNTIQPRLVGKVV